MSLLLVRTVMPLEPRESRSEMGLGSPSGKTSFGKLQSWATEVIKHLLESCLQMHPRKHMLVRIVIADIRQQWVFHMHDYICCLISRIEIKCTIVERGAC